MSDEGQVGGVEAAVMGTLVVLFGILLVAGAWGVVDAKAAASAAAREAARAYVEAPNGEAADIAAVRAARDTFDGYGRDPRAMHVERTAGVFRRCARVTFEVRHDVRLARLPGGRGGGSITVRARHSELVDPLRSGLAGAASC